MNDAKEYKTVNTYTPLAEVNQEQLFGLLDNFYELQVWI